jgi:methylenetetrahydrofolate dehydrogenase (NADP+) / methenyltetrahydrofolate cyclohydrolase
VLIDGRAYAAELAATLRRDVEALPTPPGIATIFVGDDLPAEVYQRRIDRHARELGVVSRMERLGAEATLGQVVGRIAEVDADPEISGILVLRPLPAHLPE